MTDKQGSRSRIGRVPELIALCIGVACVASLLGSTSWIFHLFTHFRMQYAALAGGLFVVFLWRRQWVWSVLVTACFVSAALPLLPYWPAAVQAATPPDGRALTIMSANLYVGNRDFARVIELVRRHEPDLLVLTEFTPRWQAGLLPLLEHYPYTVQEPREGGYGIAVLSRRPLTQGQRIELAGMPAIEVELGVGEQRVRVVGVHLRSPPGGARYAERRQQLAELAERIAQRALPTVVAGDFNATPFSPLLLQWSRRTGLIDAARGREYLGTWPTYAPPLRIPIDLCFISGEWQVVDHERLPDIGSDHYPIKTRLALSLS